MLELVEQIKTTTQLRWNRVHKFKAKIFLRIEFGNYVIKMAETSEELIESFKLRHQVFNQEFRGIQGPGLDYDKFDYHFDHLIIVDKKLNKIIGTYRLSCSTFSKESYTELEFDLTSLRNTNGPTLELGRACIHKDFRKGAVISLLWRGIAEYMNLSSSEFLYGCSSVKINNAREAALIYKHLMDEGFVSKEFVSRPTVKFSMDSFDAWYSYFKNGLNETQKNEAIRLIPSLLNSYLKLGAKVASEPAFDEDFDCIDLLTILKKVDLSNSLAEKYSLAR